MHLSVDSAILLKKPEFPDPYTVRSTIGIVENADENELTLNYNSFWSYGSIDFVRSHTCKRRIVY
jgi:hypothetical protein